MRGLRTEDIKQNCIAQQATGGRIMNGRHQVCMRNLLCHHHRNVPFYSFKDFNLRKRVPFWVVPVIIGGIAVVAAKPPMVLFLMFVAYSMSGYVMWAFRKLAAKRS